VSCQPYDHSLWVRELLGIFSLVLGNSYRALRLSFQPVVEASEERWDNRRTVE
jgi:hypothetical protein